MAGNKTKTTPAAPAGDENKQDPAVQGEQAPVNDPVVANALAVADPVPDGASQAKNEAERQDEPAPTVGQQAAPASTPDDAVAGLFEPNAIEVVAKCEQFRRAGRVFTREATIVPLAVLTEAEFTQLYHEPMLVVQLTRLPQEG